MIIIKIYELKEMFELNFIVLMDLKSIDYE